MIIGILIIWAPFLLGVWALSECNLITAELVEDESSELTEEQQALLYSIAAKNHKKFTDQHEFLARLPDGTELWTKRP